MEFVFADRADVAYHSLEEREQKRVRRALLRVFGPDAESPLEARDLHRLAQVRDKPLWVLKISPRLRLIASIEEDVVKVEDIVPRDRLDRILGRHRG